MDEKEFSFNPEAFLVKVGPGRSIAHYRKKQVIFSQADPADSVFYIQKGKVKLTVVSKQGKRGYYRNFWGKRVFWRGLPSWPVAPHGNRHRDYGMPHRSPEKKAIIDVLHAEPSFSELFLEHVLSRNIRIEEDLVDHLFNSSETRLARILLLLANFGKEGKQEMIVPNISQETLAEMVGTTRPRVSFLYEQVPEVRFHQL